MTTQNAPQDDILHSPAEVGALTLEQLRELQDGKDSNIPVRIPGLMRDWRYMRPGELTTVMALPSNWKSGFMQNVARQTADILPADWRRVVVYVTYEVAVEHLGMYDLANATGVDMSDMVDGNISDWKALERAAFERGRTPIWIIGHSLSRRKKRPDLSIDNLARVLTALENEFDMRPAVVMIDYLQRMKVTDYDKETSIFSSYVDRLKDMSLALKCHVMMGCQVRREVKNRSVHMPGMDDGGKTSNVEQSSDNVIGLWRPKVTLGEGTEFDFGEKSYTATENLQLISLLKQKFGRVARDYALRVDFATNTIKGEIVI